MDPPGNALPNFNHVVATAAKMISATSVSQMPTPFPSACGNTLCESRVIVSEQKPDGMLSGESAARAALNTAGIEVFGSSIPDQGPSNLGPLLLGTFAMTRFGMMGPEVAALLEKEVLPGHFDGSTHDRTHSAYGKV